MPFYVLYLSVDIAGSEKVGQKRERSGQRARGIQPERQREQQKARESAREPDREPQIATENQR